MNSDIGKSPSASPTLNSWKQIAVYLGRGVRTVQRWKAELGLPVHRIGHTSHSPVFAYVTELDEWLRRQAGGSNEAHIEQYEINGKLKQQIRANLGRMQGLRQELEETRITNKKLIKELQEQRKAIRAHFRQRDATQQRRS